METIKKLVRAYWLGGLAALFGAAFLFAGAAGAASIGLNLFTIGGTNGSQIIPIFPTWSINVPLAPPTNLAAASTTGGSLNVTGQQFYFQVAATNGTGTTTASSEIATTTGKSENVHLTWTAVAGASHYFVFFSTTTPGAENAYFIATTTNQYDFTSTSSPKFGTIPGFPSSFAIQASNATNTLIFNGVSEVTTASLGGSSIAAGSCNTATSTITGGSVSSTTVFITTPQKFPGYNFIWNSYALSSTQVVTTLCAQVTGTPSATAYNVKAI